MSKANVYLIAGQPVEAVKSPGGGFYYVLIPLTGERMRCLAEVFELIATKIGEKDEDQGNEGTPQKEVTG